MKYRDYVKQEIAVIKDRDPVIKSIKRYIFILVLRQYLNIEKPISYILRANITRRERFHRKLQDRLELRYIRERRLAKDFLLTMDMELLSERQLLSVTM